MLSSSLIQFGRSKKELGGTLGSEPLDDAVATEESARQTPRRRHCRSVDTDGSEHIPLPTSVTGFPDPEHIPPTSVTGFQDPLLCDLQPLSIAPDRGPSSRPLPDWNPASSMLPFLCMDSVVRKIGARELLDSNLSPQPHRRQWVK